MSYTIRFYRVDGWNLHFFLFRLNHTKWLTYLSSFKWVTSIEKTSIFIVSYCRCVINIVNHGELSTIPLVTYCCLCLLCTLMSCDIVLSIRVWWDDMYDIFFNQQYVCIDTGYTDVIIASVLTLSSDTFIDFFTLHFT